MPQRVDQFISRARRTVLPECSWATIHEAGAYVERQSGDLYRIPNDAFTTGAGPIVVKESFGPSRMVRVSRNPFIMTQEARLRCARHNVSANF